MRILLTNPPWEVDGKYGCRAGSRWPFLAGPPTYVPFPFFLAYATSYLQSKDIDAHFYDAMASWAYSDDNYFYIPIKTILKKKFTGTVYNLYIEKEHSFVVQAALVHNCGGGEPFLHPKMREFILLSHELGLKLGSLTNGTRLFGDMAELVVDTFSYVRISIDSFNPHTYSSIRRVDRTGPNSLDCVIKNIKYLVALKKTARSKLLITLKAVFSRDTVCELPLYIDTAPELGVDGINIKGVRNVPNELRPSDIPTGVSLYLDMCKRSNVEGKPWVFGSLTNTTINTPGCFACNFHVFIDTGGELRICCYYQNRPVEHTYGIITTTNLKDLWESVAHKDAVKNIDTTKCNNYNCKYHNYNNVLHDGIVKDEGQWQFT